MQISIRPNLFGLSILLSACLFFLFTPEISRAIEPGTSLAQYAHQVWRFGDAGLLGSPLRITQTADGYIWASTSNGLFRFDGVRFTRWIPPSGESLPGSYVEEIFGAHNGSLYVGRDSGLSRITNGHVYNYPGSPRRSGPFIEDTEGNVWMGTSGTLNDASTLCRVEDKTVTCMGAKDGFACDNGKSYTIDASGYIWIGSYKGTCKWKPGTAPQVEPVPILAKQTGQLDVGSLATGSDGAVWAGMSWAAPGSGLLRFANGKWAPYIAPGIDGTKLAVTSLLAGRQGSLWIGTIDQGLFKLAGGRLDHFSRVDGLSGDEVHSIFEDHEGGIWIVTQMGIDYFRDYDVLTLTVSRGGVGGVAANRQGTVFFGDRALTALHNGALTQIKDPQGHVIDGVECLFTDSQDRTWIAVGDRLLLLMNERNIEEIASLPNELVIYITEARDHDIWVSLQNLKTHVPSLIQLRDRHVVATYYETDVVGRQPMNALAPNPAGGIWAGGLRHGLFWFHNRHFERISAGGFNGRVENLLTEKSGALWIVTANGFIRYADGHAKTLTAADGLPCDKGVNVQEDGQGAMWFYAYCGILRVREAELTKWWNSNAHIHGRVFGPLEGAQPGRSNGSPTQTPDGRLWSASTHLYQVIDPHHLPFNSSPPPTKIETFEVDGKAFVPDRQLKLPIHSRQIEIGYAGLSFLIPEKVQFRYRLIGHDKGWTDAGSRRQAFFNDLVPGKYSFHVIASNNDGVWSKTGATLSFTVPPAWYQTYWFRMLCVLSLVGLIYAVYLLRMRQYAAAMRARFNERVDERVRIARELHDTLLQSFHGLMFQFQAARNMLPRRPESAMQAFDEAISATEQAIAEGRDAIHDLRPELATQQNLAVLLTAAGQELTGAHAANGHSPNFRVVVEGKPRNLFPTLQDEVYRIGREVIRNAFNHAAANRIEVEIRYDDAQLRLRIRDDGKGIDPGFLEASSRPGHWGLPGIRERAQRIGSRLEFWSQSGAGTEVELRVPGAIAYERPRDGYRFRLFHRGGSNDGHS